MAPWELEQGHRPAFQVEEGSEDPHRIPLRGIKSLLGRPHPEVPPPMGRGARGECAGSERPAGDGGRPAPPHRAAPHLRRVPGPPGRRPEGLRALVEGAKSDPHWWFFLTMANATVRFFL